VQARACVRIYGYIYYYIKIDKRAPARAGTLQREGVIVGADSHQSRKKGCFCRFCRLGGVTGRKNTKSGFTAFFAPCGRLVVAVGAMRTSCTKTAVFGAFAAGRVGSARAGMIAAFSGVFGGVRIKKPAAPLRAGGRGALTVGAVQGSEELPKRD
jgi:hypothetical protein